MLLKVAGSFIHMGENMSPFPTEPQKIKKQINRYEAALRKEYEKYRCINDGSGTRYLLGHLYLLLGDIPGVIKSFEWFAREFNDDSGESFHTLCWALALYRSGNMAGAAKKLRDTMLSNMYMLPYLFGIEQPQLDIWHSTNLERKDYVEQAPPELYKLWDEQALRWAQGLYKSDDFRCARERTIEIFRRLKSEPQGTTRLQLVKELSVIRGSNPA